MSSIKEKRVYFKSEARFFLRYNYIRQIFMTAVAMLVTAGLNSLKNSAVLLINAGTFTLPLQIFFDVLIFLIVMPMWIGIFYVSKRLFEGERLTIGAMFEFYSSSDGILNCLKLMFSLFVRLTAFFSPFLVFALILSNIGVYLDKIISDNISADIVMVCVCAAFFIIFALCVVFMMRYFAVLYIFLKNPYLSMNEIVKKSVTVMKKRKIEAVNFLLSFSVWIALSFLLAGIPFIFFTLPYMILSYISFFSFSFTSDEEENFFSSIGDMIDERNMKKEQFVQNVVFEEAASTEKENINENTVES